MFISKKRLKSIEERLDTLEKLLAVDKPAILRGTAKLKAEQKILRAQVKGKPDPSNQYFDGVELD